MTQSMESDRPSVAILLNYEQDSVAWGERFARGETLDQTPYGYHRAEKHFALSWATSHPESPFARRFRLRVSRFCGFDAVHAWRNRAMLFAADVIWTHTEREHLAVALLQRFRLPAARRPVLAQSVWLWDAWPEYGAFRRSFIAWLLRSHPVEVVHSKVNREASRRSAPGRRVELLPFGSERIETDARNGPDAGARPLVVAVGNDIHRDWPTLAAAANTLPHYDFRIVSRTRAAREANWPASTEVAPSSSRQELSALYSQAAVVVIPLTQNLHASGATSVIEALGVARPVVVTNTGGIDDYAGGVCALVEVGDAKALAAAIARGVEGALAAPAHDAAQMRGLTQADYVNRYVLATEWLLGRHPWSESISDFEPVVVTR